jgi:hypothetical protein
VLFGSDGGSGTANYTTGAYALTFAVAPTVGAQIGAYYDGKVIPDDLLSVGDPVTVNGWGVSTDDSPESFFARWSRAQYVVVSSMSSWKQSHIYAVGELVQPTVSNGFYYSCTQGGTSGIAEPTWSTVLNGTTVDSGARWITIGATQRNLLSDFVPNVPTEILIYNRKVTMRPPPDKAYLAKFAAVTKPSALVNVSDAPLQDAWGQYIAFGTALDIAISSGDEERAGLIGQLIQAEKVVIARPDLIMRSGRRSRGSF